MNQFKKRVAKAAFIIMVANSCQTAQAIDWNYWSTYACDSARQLAQHAPSRERIIEQLKQPKTCVALVAVVAIIGMYIKAKLSIPTPDLETSAKSLLKKPIKGLSYSGCLVICNGLIVCEIRRKECKDSLDEQYSQVEEYGEHEKKEVFFKYHPKFIQIGPNRWVGVNQCYSRFNTGTFAQIDTNEMARHIKALDEVISKHESKNTILRSDADKKLLDQFKVRKAQLEVLKGIVEEAKKQ